MINGNDTDKVTDNDTKDNIGEGNRLVILGSSGHSLINYSSLVISIPSRIDYKVRGGN